MSRLLRLRRLLFSYVPHGGWLFRTCSRRLTRAASGRLASGRLASGRPGRFFNIAWQTPFLKTGRQKKRKKTGTDRAIALISEPSPLDKDERIGRIRDAHGCRARTSRFDAARTAIGTTPAVRSVLPSPVRPSPECACYLRGKKRSASRIFQHELDTLQMSIPSCNSLEDMRDCA